MYCADTGRSCADREVGDLLDLAAGLRRQALRPRRSRAAGSRACCRSRTAARSGRAPGAAPRARRACRSAPGSAETRHSGSTSACTVLAGARPRPVSTSHGVHDQALDRSLHVDDLEVRAVGGDDALVGDLAAGLGVERGAVEHDLDRRWPGSSSGDALAVERPGRATRRLAWSARCSATPVGRARAPAGRCQTSVLAWPPFLDLASALARSRCSLMSRRKPVAVDLEALLGGHLQGQVDREAVGVVQLEGLRRPASGVPPA